GRRGPPPRGSAPSPAPPSTAPHAVAAPVRIGSLREPRKGRKAGSGRM
ncbi:MAG: hypothetical protein AVDCRST_MAG69-618, partial [uncultured Solirubrobacteraceae bacterium]